MKNTKNLSKLFILGVFLVILIASCKKNDTTEKEVSNFIDIIGKCHETGSINSIFQCFERSLIKYKKGNTYSEYIYGALERKIEDTDYSINFFQDNQLPNDTIQSIHIIFISSNGLLSDFTSDMVINKLGSPAGITCNNDSVWIIRNGCLILDNQFNALKYFSNAMQMPDIIYFDRYSLPLRQSLVQTIQSDSQYVQFHRIKNTSITESKVLTLFGMHGFYTISMSEGQSQLTPINFELTYKNESSASLNMQISLDTIVNNYGSLFTKLNLDSYYQDIEKAIDYIHNSKEDDTIMYKSDPDWKILHMFRDNIIIQVQKITQGVFISFQIGFFPICDPPVAMIEIKNFRAE